MLIYDNSELRHYGVKGMKWGHRKYQNPDGSLTAKGKKRLLKNQKAWERDVRDNWTHAYNNAANAVNSKLDSFNKKYENENLSDRNSEVTKRYVKEYCDMFNSLYVKELNSRFGESPVQNAKKHVANLPEEFKEKSWKELVPMMLDYDAEISEW